MLPPRHRDWNCVPERGYRVRRSDLIPRICSGGGWGTGMRRIGLIAATALGAAFAQGAHAADMAVSPFTRAAPIVIGYNWQGYYLGANIGWSRASSDISWSTNPTGFLTVGPGGTLLSDVGPISSASKNTLSSNGAAGGIQTGYNWQWGNVVAGIE